jgi:hypothetical protein
VSKTRRVRQRARAIRRLAKLRETFGSAAAERERLLRACGGGARCRSGKELSSLHETLCFARAYPDNQAMLDLVQDRLDRWERRADVHALGEALQGIGMAGVANAYPFFWPTARWLAERWPGALHVDWDNLEDADGVASLLQLLMPRHSPALEVVGFAEALAEPGNKGRIERSGIDEADHRHRRLLRPRRQRPSDRRAAEKRDELAPPHSITSSARASSVGGTVMPNTRAVSALMTNSNLLDCATGRSAGFAPLRMRPA